MGIKATAFSWAELGYFPDTLLRMAIRRLCHQLSQDVTPIDEMARLQQLQQWIADMDRSPVALATSE
ncbi:MAG: hypothetical protein VX223_16805, partial [Myxococcota bacterium]|nr:hypothetical protein [Myxococcota bacterium]